MKKYIYILLTIVLLSCNAKVMPDCFQNAGPIIQMEIPVSTFSKIIVFERVQLILKEGPEHKVIVETGEYLRDDIEVTIEDDVLLLKDHNACNITRDYGITKIYVSAPNITDLRSSSGLPILSDGVLNYSNLTLMSEDFDAEGEYHTVGDFRLEVNCTNLQVVTNNLSHIYLNGTVENLEIGFYSGDSRFEGRNLVAQNISIFQRSSNDMIINPQASLRGEIRSTGNVIVVNEPPVMEVQTYYKGRLIIE
ncbi:head GIN domain-containing protein [Gelidibacter sp.]|uniref:head GIN domain-containing protein n=1 Tax=Gelidibacter sp. TaxID=2018083 RepID=UPI002CE8D973|nr:head GIN domain-containing protein [Gelidibacter sp.]HUH29635.1 head GIN domain-containing protein [Gelidibacter sp.]